jgi:EAL domain-containing protein (putative c-di-GMP-specific phosphodiesterase class I)
MGRKSKILDEALVSQESHGNGELRPVKSISSDDIWVVYQPIVEMSTGLLFAHESLVRCTVEHYTDPVNLFDQAVKEDSCGSLGRAIREVAFANNPDNRLFVNIHPSELMSPWLVRPDDPLCFHKPEVFLEITESAVIEYYDLCVNVLTEVCSRNNAHLVIDDLGAGYSNLLRLVELYPSVVKLDIALTRNLDKDHRKQILVRHIVEMCVELNAKVVVEGIETINELKAVRDTGAHYGQGYLLARPGFPPPHVKWPL